jgi:hypothetical protein
MPLKLEVNKLEKQINGVKLTPSNLGNDYQKKIVDKKVIHARNFSMTGPLMKYHDND